MMVTQRTSVREKSNYPIYATDEMDQLCLVCPDAGFCDVMQSSEREFLDFVRKIVHACYTGSIRNTLIREIIGDLRTHDMDETGRFYLLDSLAHLKRVKELELIRRKSEVMV